MGFVWGMRWILVLIAPFVGFYSALFIGLLIDGFIAGLCPPEHIVSGLCTATWYARAEDAVIGFGAALAAVFVVLLPTLLAPEKRLVVAVTFYILGAVAAFSMTLPARSLTSVFSVPVSVALVSGALSVLFVKRFLTGRTTQM